MKGKLLLVIHILCKFRCIYVIEKSYFFRFTHHFTEFSKKKQKETTLLTQKLK